MPERNETAVSPVIAAILIIAITLALAGVFALFALGYGNTGLTAKIVGVTASPYSTGSDHGVIAQFWGGKDLDELRSVSAYISDLQLVLQGTEESVIVNPQVGVSYYFSTQSGHRTVETTGGTQIEMTEMIDIDTSTPQYVTFVGKFADGTEQVIYMWKMPIPEITSDPGVYFQNEYVKVTGYANNAGWLGHGLLIQRLKPEVTLGTNIGSIVTAYALTPAGGSAPYTSGLFSGGIQMEYGTDGTVYYTLPFIAGNTFLPYNSPPSQASEMSGTVTIQYKVNGVTQTFENIAVHIPERVNVNMTSQAYAGDIVSYTENSARKKDELYVRLNDISNIQTGNQLASRISVYLNNGGVRTLLASIPKPAYWTDYFTPSGHALTEEYNLTVLSGDVVVEAYITGSQSRDGTTNANTVWYLVGAKKVSELVNSA